ncbi:fibrosin-1-like protein isoform X2 [Pteropus medius]|uniref:fibrosin-1-like protein isoform X2 n=1 Tax=Pteropus vampyrus TaxID=132908 RepID=UPI00196AD060|nr:fibrosin-1-like protein isoform X2 [Pteropus giganteus]
MVAGPGSNKCWAAGRCHRIRACQRSCRRSQLAQNSWRLRGGVNPGRAGGAPASQRGLSPGPAPAKPPHGARGADPAGPTPPPRTRGCLGERKRRGRRSLREEEEEVEERELGNGVKSGFVPRKTEPVLSTTLLTASLKLVHTRLTSPQS